MAGKKTKANKPSRVSRNSSKRWLANAYKRQKKNLKRILKKYKKGYAPYMTQEKAIAMIWTKDDGDRKKSFLKDKDMLAIIKQFPTARENTRAQITVKLTDEELKAIA